MPASSSPTASSPHGPVRFRLLGGLRVDIGASEVELGGPKQRAVLAALLLNLGRPVSADRLIELVWGDDRPNSAELSLQAYVSNLRRAVEPARQPRHPPQILLTTPAGYHLAAPRHAVDLALAEDLAADGHAQVAAGDLHRAVTLFDAALELWSLPVLPEFAERTWVLEHAAHVATQRRQALVARMDAGLALGQHLALLPLLEAAIVVEPFDERLRGQLALALYRSGRQRDALAALTDARATLAEELGLQPTPALLHLEAQVLANDPALDVSPAPGTPPPPSRRTPDPRVERLQPEQEDASSAFVGRRRELGLLRDALAHATSARGRTAVISGEPGIGKTRLVEELVRNEAGIVVAWARCPETGAQSAYWPCVQLGRQLEGTGVLDPQLTASLLPTDDRSLRDEVSADHFALHVGVARVLAAIDRPLLLVIDDLQWADPSTLRLIQFVAAELHHTSVLLVVTTRRVSTGAPPALIDCLGELARQPGTVRIDLEGLSEAEVAALVSRRAGGAADPEVAAVVRDRSGGNPFFAGEVVELLALEDRLTDAAAARRGTVPTAVHDVIRRRVSRLPAASQQLLSVAAVVGRTFDVDVVAAVTTEPVLVVLERLEPALETGLVDETDRPGRYQFSHTLVAEALVAEVNAARRARLHAATAGALETLRAGDIEPYLAELAHHAFAGAAAGTADAAYRWSVQAALAASARRANEDAAQHWARAARSLELSRPSDRSARAEALLEEGRAHLAVDALEPAYAALTAAIDLALALAVPDEELLGRIAAAMNVEGLWFTGEVGLISHDAAAALRRALHALPASPTVHRALALGALAENLYWLAPLDELDSVSGEAVEMARQAANPVVLARCLQKRAQAMWRAGTLDARADAAFEVLDLVGEHPTSPELEALALYGAASVWWERGDVRRAHDHVEKAAVLAARAAAPALITQLDFFRVSIDLWNGRLRSAEERIDVAFELYRRTRRFSAEAFRAGFKSMVWTEQGRLDDVRAAAPAFLDNQYRPWFGEAYAHLLVELGSLDEAADIVAGRMPPLEDSWLLLGALTAAANTRAALGDREAGRAIRDRLQPFAGRLAAVGTGPSVGDVHLALARLERALGNTDAARRHASASVEVCRAAGAGPWLVRSLLLRAELTGQPADRAEAAAIVAAQDLPLLRSRL